MIKLIPFSGLGHLLEMPNMPVCHFGLNLHAKQDFDYGGSDIQAHSLSTELAWQKIIQFFNDY